MLVTKQLTFTIQKKYYGSQRLLTTVWLPFFQISSFVFSNSFLNSDASIGLKTVINNKVFFVCVSTRCMSTYMPGMWECVCLYSYIFFPMDPLCFPAPGAQYWHNGASDVSSQLRSSPFTVCKHLRPSFCLMWKHLPFILPVWGNISRSSASFHTLEV